MSPRPVPLWRTLINLALLAGAVLLAWQAYEQGWFEKFGFGGSSEPLAKDQSERMVERIEKTFGSDPCFYMLQGPPIWRPRDNYYKIELQVDFGCEGKAYDLCKGISDLVDREFHVNSSVWAYLKDGTREVGRFVR